MGLLQGIQIIAVLFGHWLADFPGQASEWGLGKHSSNKLLLTHTSVYTIILSCFLVVIYGAAITPIILLKFAAITFISHTITDYFTSRWNAKQYTNSKFKLWINSIGFDQWLHQIQLVLTCVYLHIIV